MNESSVCRRPGAAVQGRQDCNRQAILTSRACIAHDNSQQPCSSCTYSCALAQLTVAVAVCFIHPYRACSPSHQQCWLNQNYVEERSSMVTHRRSPAHLKGRAAPVPSQCPTCKGAPPCQCGKLLSLGRAKESLHAVRIWTKSAAGQGAACFDTNPHPCPGAGGHSMLSVIQSLVCQHGRRERIDRTQLSRASSRRPGR